LRVESRGRDAIDLTPIIEKTVREEGVEEGVVIVYVEDPLCALVTLEYDADLVEDLWSMLDKLPSANPHVKASIFHRSVVIPIEQGRPALGSFQQLCLLDLSSEAGGRRVVVKVIPR